MTSDNRRTSFAPRGVQLAFDFDAPPPAVLTAARVDLADFLIEKGLAPNRYWLESGVYDLHASVPAPSRLYKFPIEYTDARRSGVGVPRLYLRSPGISDLPFVQRVQNVIGERIEFPVGKALGHDLGVQGRWHHAVDLANDESVEHLLATLHLTDNGALLQAIGSNLKSSAIGNRRSQLSTANARKLLRCMGVPGEPADRSEGAILGDGISASRGKNGWLVSTAFGFNPWVMLHGIEDGWFTRGRDGFMILSSKALDQNPKAVLP